MSKIGFNLTSGPTEEIQEEVGPPTVEADVIENMLKELFTVPDWQVDFEKSLFWACVFNTQNKVNEC
jgi:hypothetical protein